MGKKEKKVFALTEDLQTLITIVPKLEAFIKVHKEIAAGYQKYRKTAGWRFLASRNIWVSRNKRAHHP